MKYSITLDAIKDVHRRAVAAGDQRSAHYASVSAHYITVGDQATTDEAATRAYDIAVELINDIPLHLRKEE